MASSERKQTVEEIENLERPFSHRIFYFVSNGNLTGPTVVINSTFAIEPHERTLKRNSDGQIVDTAKVRLSAYKSTPIVRKKVLERGKPKPPVTDPDQVSSLILTISEPIYIGDQIVITPQNRNKTCYMVKIESSAPISATEFPNLPPNIAELIQPIPQTP